MKRLLIAGLLFAAFAALPGFASTTDTTQEEKTTVFGCMHYSFGQMESGTYKGEKNTHVWLQRLVGDITLKARPSERLTLYLGAEVDLNFSIYEMYQYMETMIRYVTIYPFHFEGVVSILDNPNAKLDIGIGSFPFKYNGDSRDLGEYLFRSSCYPPNLSTAFDFSEAWLLGLRVHNTLFNRITQDLLLTTETNYPPVHDYSLSYIASGKIAPGLELGAGVNFHHLFSVNEAKTTPSQSVDNRYIDSSRTPPDTGYYTFRGTKLMGRISFDPKALFPSDFFGKEDLRLYSEVSVLGLKNYPGFYADRSQRMPVMVGFNVPFFKLLDVCAVEVEYYSNPYLNSYENQFPASTMGVLPMPTPFGGATHNDDNWKWAVYAKKTFLRNCILVFQVADDHMRTREANFNVADPAEALNHGDWYYMCKAKFTF
jgi:hypothetical protein